MGEAASIDRPHNWVPAGEDALYTPRRIRIVCVGAGFSGLMLAHKYETELKNLGCVDLTIFEKNSDVGGVWLENRYPGVACDVPSHIYCFPFEGNPDWTTFYASGTEIWEYMKRTAQKYNLEDHVQTNSKVISATWNESHGHWNMKVEQNGKVKQQEADVLVNGSGVLNKWSWPQIKNLHSFGGKVVHSANWDTTIDWTGKTVAIIGNGSSAVQILPQMQPKAKRIVNYARSPTWVTPNFAAEFTPEGKNFTFSEEYRQNLRENPAELLKVRHDIEHSFNKFYRVLVGDSPEQAFVREMTEKQMRERLQNDEELCAKLIPSWKIGCRRLSPGENYLESLLASNVSLDGRPIQEVTQSGIRVGDSVEDFDIIVCATGFDVSYMPSFELFGRDGANLKDQWKQCPEAYFGTCVPGFPNYFVVNGPNSPIAHGSLLSVIDCTLQYIMRWCKKISAEDIKSVEVQREATDDYNTYTQEAVLRTVFTDGCNSWFKNASGRVVAMYAGSTLHFREIMESFRSEDFDIKYKSRNRFSFMGNGFTLREEAGGDLAFYLK